MEWCSANLGKDSSLAVEGIALLQALSSSFLNSGHEVSTILHLSLKNACLMPGMALIINDGQTPFPELFVKLLLNSDRVLLIAPETGGILAGLTALVELTGKPHLGSSVSGVLLAQYKDLTLELLHKEGIPVPKTKLLPGKEELKTVVASWGFPLVLKPRDGAGSENIFLINRAEEINGVLERFAPGYIMVQEYLPGEHASVTILSDGNKVYPLSLNMQYIIGTSPFSYQGGLVGWEHPLHAKARDIAKKAWKILGGLRGFGGIDLVFYNDEVFVMEINPRPTTPLCALVRAITENLGILLLDCLDGKNIGTLTWRQPVRFQKAEPFMLITAANEVAKAVEGGCVIDEKNSLGYNRRG